MNEIARNLNCQILQENSHVYDLLSELGKNLYFPKGILTQSEEAKQKAHRFNATIGIATEHNQPMFLPLIQETLSNYDPKDLFPYAPPAGKPALRELWREKIIIHNPSLKGKLFSNPIVTNALTHGLSIVADLFVDENDPLGYTPSKQEALEIVEALKEVAEQGMNLTVVIDDAYFGLFYENSIKESLFALIANIHPRILAIKVDGATKEDYVWGLRVGFITYACEHQAVLDALEQKTLGIIRGTISSASHPAQTFVLKALQSPEFQAQKQEKFEVLKKRACKVKQILDQGKYLDAWDYYPFNSGYFMCLKLKGVRAEALRKHLLDHYGVGIISLCENDVRIAFSCVEEQDLEQLFDLVYQGFKDLSK